MKGAYGKARLGTIAILGVAAFAIMAAAERARLRKGIPKFSNSRNVWGDCMKRILLSSIVAGGLALMTAPPASALPPGLCGHSYAMLMKGAEPQLVSATGGTGLPGAITSAFGVGTITFAASTDGTDCTATGELIYNCGDIQTNPISLYFGPAVCYASASALGTGLPCFDGQNNFAAGLLSKGGPNGSYILSFDANYSWFDAQDTEGTFPFGFWIQNTLGSRIAVGTSIPGTVDASLPGNGAPVLSITLQQQGIVPVATSYGAAPYKGEAAISCLAQGANSTDSFAASQAAAANGFGPTVAGGFESTGGSIAIFTAPPSGPACLAGGGLSFNSNDNYVTSGTPASNNYCPFSFLPGDCIDGYSASQTGPAFSTTASQFVDGASNGSAFIGTSAYNCSDALTVGAGYATSAVQWGTSDANSYVMPTGLVSTATGYVPLGGSSACTEYEQLPTAGNITNLVVPTTLHSIFRGPPATGPIFGSVMVRHPTDANCDIEISMPSPTGSGTDSGPTCSFNLADASENPSNPEVDTDVPGPAPFTQVATTECYCFGPQEFQSETLTLTITSVHCPLSGTTSYEVTCQSF